MNNESELLTKGEHAWWPYIYCYTNSNGDLEFEIQIKSDRSVISHIEASKYIREEFYRSYFDPDKDKDERYDWIKMLPVEYNALDSKDDAKIITRTPLYISFEDLNGRFLLRCLPSFKNLRGSDYENLTTSRLNYDLTKKGIEYLGLELEIYFKENKKTIAERKKKDKAEELRKEAERRKKKQKQVAEENRKKQEEQAIINDRKEKQRLDGIINSVINNNLSQVNIYVNNFDGYTLVGADIDLTSDAVDPRNLLIQNGFPSNRLHEFNIPEYPNSWNGNKTHWGNKKSCKIQAENQPCTFKIYKGANYQIMIRYRNYEPYGPKEISFDDGNSKELTFDKQGIPIEIKLFDFTKMRKKE